MISVLSFGYLHWSSIFYISQPRSQMKYSAAMYYFGLYGFAVYSRQSLSYKWRSSANWNVMEERENLFSKNKRTSHHWYWTWHIYLFVFKAHIRQIWLLPKSSISDEQQKFRGNICLTIWTTFHCLLIEKYFSHHLKNIFLIIWKKKNFIILKIFFSPFWKNFLTIWKIFFSPFEQPSTVAS